MKKTKKISNELVARLADVDSRIFSNHEAITHVTDHIGTLNVERESIWNEIRDEIGVVSPKMVLNKIKKEVEWEEETEDDNE